MPEPDGRRLTTRPKLGGGKATLAAIRRLVNDVPAEVLAGGTPWGRPEASAHMLADKPAYALYGLLTLSENRRVQMPYVWHVIPDLEPGVDTGLLRKVD